MKLSVKSFTFFLIIVSLFISCKTKRNDFYKQNVSDSIFFLETPLDADLEYVIENNRNFNKLQKKDRSNLNRVLKNPENLVWLRIKFSVDEPLKDKNIALYIAQLESSSWLFCNGNSIKKYGSAPPNAMNCGSVAHYYLFPKKIINFEGENTIYIQVWPGLFGSLSDEVFIGEQDFVYKLADYVSFFNAKITISFLAIMQLIFLLYFVLYLILRKKDSHSNRVYLLYSLLALFTAFFLFPFAISEYSWIIPPFISYLSVIKTCLFCSSLITVYFANSFMVSYISMDFSKKEHISRLVILTIPIIITMCLQSVHALSKFLPFGLLFMFSDFIFSIPKLIKAIRIKEKKRELIKLTVGFSPTVLTVITDILLRMFFKINSLPYITLYGWQITITIFLLYLVNDFGLTYLHNKELKTQVEELNTNLEEIVAMRTKELSEANYVLSRGLETVSYVQKNFLPPTEAVFYGFDFSAFYQPLDNGVSGDLYDFYYTGWKLDGIGLFDVSGHGIPAGLMTILSKGIISQHFINGLEQKVPLSDILQEINTDYIKEKVNVENYFTALIFRFSGFDENDVCHAEVANAGHPYPLLYCAKDNSVTELKCENESEQYGFIGIEGLETSFPPVNFSMDYGDVLVCFTDGLTEATNKENVEFSKERIIKILKESNSLTSSEIRTKIIQSLKIFMDDNPVQDDITLIVLKRNNSKNFIEGI